MSTFGELFARKMQGEDISDQQIMDAMQATADAAGVPLHSVQIGALQALSKKKALLLDLDSTLIKTKSGETFPVDKNDWELMPGIVASIAQHTVLNWGIVIVSNQGGIEAGFHKQEDIVLKIRLVCGELIHQLNELNAVTARTFVGYYFCPTMDLLDAARKPNPGMILAARDEWNLDLSQCLMVGDMESDRQAATNAGVPYKDILDFLAA